MSYSVSRVQWQHAAPLLRDLRERVFICEWRIPKRVEFDRNDNSAYHMIVCDDDTQEPIATGRMLATGEISRVAVLRQYRKQHIDEVVVKGLLNIARELDLSEVSVKCPLEKVPHFKANNFRPSGSVFMEAGIPRQRMVCQLERFCMAKCYLSH